MDGDLVPFYLENIDIKSDESALLKLRDISFDKAAKYIGLSLYLPFDPSEQLIPSSPQLIGFKVIDKKKGDIGIVAEIIEKQMQDLLEIHYNDKQILIPVDKSIIKKIDIENKTIHINAPEGLIDLYL